MVAALWGQAKVPVAWIIGIIICGSMLHEWADMHYIPFAEAVAQDKALEAKINDNHEMLEKKIDSNTFMLKEHIQGYRINENAKAIDLVRDQQFELNQYEALSGETQMTRERRDELTRKLEQLLEQRDCIRSHGDHCGD